MKNIIYIVLISLLFSCVRHDKNKLIITEFNDKIVDTLHPYNKSYTAYNINIKGYVNDSIRIGFGPDSYSFYFKGEIDKKLIFDYYGQFERLFIFDPYKATEGRLEIKYGLY
jgi:hypothetical protein